MLRPAVIHRQDPDFGKALVKYSRICTQRDGWLMLLEAIRATTPPDEHEVALMNVEDTAAGRLGAPPLTPAGPGQGIATRRVMS